MRGIWVEENEAEGSIGKSAIGVKGIVPMSQGCKIEMHSFDEGVAGIITRWKRYKIATIQGRHHEGTFSLWQIASNKYSWAR